MVSKRIGNKKCGLLLYLLLIFINLIVHIIIFFYGKKVDAFDILNFIVSFIAFTYTVCFIADFIWSIRPSVISFLNSNKKINRMYYMNSYELFEKNKKLPNVTISIPVYTEDNSVIFETIKQSIIAKDSYLKDYKSKCNIVISDDGLASLLHNNLSNINNLYDDYIQNEKLSKDEIKAMERIDFYRRNNIGFVARPLENRKGLFKKASNLNYTILLDKKNCDGYYEGNVETYDIILLLDKDSGVPKDIIKAIVPEFTYDKTLAYVQCSTDTINIDENFYTKVVGKQTNDLFHNIWPNQALRGFFVPIVGHNVFIRKSSLAEINYWNENKVSEDFDAAINLYSKGYHGKYAQIKGLEFTEYCSRSFIEETSKQHRYIYGIFEMMFDGTIKLGKTRNYDIFYMILYFIYKLSIISTIPYTLFILLFCSSRSVGILCFGFFIIHLIFIILPFIRKLLLINSIDEKYLFTLKESILLSISFVGHSFVSLSGCLLYFINKFKKNKQTFKSTSVDKINYSFQEGINVFKEFIKNNKLYIVVIVVCIYVLLNIIQRDNLFIFFKLIYLYIITFVLLTPIIFTTQFFSFSNKSKQILKYIPVTAVFVFLLLIPLFNLNGSKIEKEINNNRLSYFNYSFDRFGNDFEWKKENYFALNECFFNEKLINKPIPYNNKKNYCSHQVVR